MKDKESLFKKIKNIIKRVLSVQTVGLMIMAPGSEANEQKEKIYDNTEQTTTSFKDDLQVPTTQEELTKILEGEVTESETKVNGIDNQKSEENTTLVQQEIEETTINYNNEDLLYNRLLEKFNEKTSENNFLSMSYKYLKSFFDNVYENYDEWYQANKDLPDKETYITKNIINVLDNVEDIHFIQYNSTEYEEEIEKKNRGLAYTDRNFIITVVYNSSLEDYSLEVERIGHELEHVNQANIVYNQNYFEDYEYLRDIIIEGGATSAMKYSKKISSEKTASNYIDYESYSLEYKIDNGEGYARYMSLYNELMYFVGYDTMQKIKLGEEPISVIEEKLEDKYGSDITNSIFKELENLDKAYSHNDDKAKFTSATNLQNYFNRCVEKDIEDLVNSKQAEEYKNRYNNYYKNIIPQMSKDNKNITTQYFKMDNIDTKLQEKIKEVAKEEYYR